MVNYGELIFDGFNNGLLFIGRRQGKNQRTKVRHGYSLMTGCGLSCFFYGLPNAIVLKAIRYICAFHACYQFAAEETIWILDSGASLAFHNGTAAYVVYASTQTRYHKVAWTEKVLRVNTLGGLEVVQVTMIDCSMPYGA